jgi:hypothetical protein
MIFEIADAIIEYLNERVYSKEFTAELSTLPRFERSDFENLRVIVLPSGEVYANSTRGSYEVDSTIDIGLQVKVSKDWNSDVKEYSVLATEIINSLFNVNFADAKFVSIVREPVYDVEALAQQYFLTYITVMYRHWDKFKDAIKIED